MSTSSAEKDILEACVNIPHTMLELHRVFVKIIDEKMSFKFVKKTNVDECAMYAEWYEYGKERFIQKERSSLTTSDPEISKYSNVENFVDECCQCEETYNVPQKLLYKRYGVWCQTSRCPTLEIRMFIKHLKKLGYIIKLDMWSGLKLA